MGRSDCIYTKNSARPRSDPDRKIYGPDRKISSQDRKIYSPDRKICGLEQLGAMRQKMAIFKEGNSVCRVHFFQELSFYVQKELMNDFFQICIFLRPNSRARACHVVQFFSFKVDLRFGIGNLGCRPFLSEYFESDGGKQK